MSFKIDPQRLQKCGWDVFDHSCGSKFQTAGHDADLGIHQVGWRGESSAALTLLRDHWATAALALHNRLDTLADNMKTGAALYDDAEQDHAAALERSQLDMPPADASSASFDPADL